MRIGIDARFYGPSSTGLGRYTAELISHLLAHNPDLRLTLFVRRESWSAVPRDARVERVLFPHRWYSLAEQVLFPRVIRRAQLDLMHFPHFNVPLATPRPFIVTIHDLILHDFPTERATTLGPVQYWLKRQAYHLVIRRAVERAAQVITISNASADSLVRHFHLARERITVTYEGPSTLPVGVDQRPPAGFSVDSGSRFLLYVGNAYPHKNLEQLLRAFLIVRQRHPRTRLVLVCKDDYFSRRLKTFAVEIGLRPSSDTFVTGYVTDEELVWFYRHAAVYVFPSLAEGFGLPALEAMSLDLPVVASNASCLPEVLGDAALYFNPGSADDLAHVVGRVLSDERLRTFLVQRGKQRVARYSWERLASETLAVYRFVVTERGRHGAS